MTKITNYEQFEASNWEGKVCFLETCLPEDTQRIKQAMIDRGWGYESQYPFFMDNKTELHYFLFRHKALNICYCSWKETEAEAVIHAAARTFLEGK